MRLVKFFLKTAFLYPELNQHKWEISGPNIDKNAFRKYVFNIYANISDNQEEI